jgi:hypothetical protein
MSGNRYESPGRPRTTAVAALRAARRGDRGACSYLFVRFADDLHVEFVEAGLESDLASQRVIRLFTQLPHSGVDADFIDWLSRRVEGPVPAGVSTGR